MGARQRGDPEADSGGRGRSPRQAGVRGDRDPAAVEALLHAGVLCLVLRSTNAGVYMGVDLQTEEGGRIDRAIESLFEACFKAQE